MSKPNIIYDSDHEIDDPISDSDSKRNNSLIMNIIMGIFDTVYNISDIYKLYDNVSAKYNKHNSVSRHNIICSHILFCYVNEMFIEYDFDGIKNIIDYVTKNHKVINIDGIIDKYRQWSYIERVALYGNGEKYDDHANLLLRTLEYLDEMNIDYDNKNIIRVILACPRRDLLEFMVNKYSIKDIETELHNFCISGNKNFIKINNIYDILESYTYLLDHGITFDKCINVVLAKFMKMEIDTDIIKYIIDTNLNVLHNNDSDVNDTILTDICEYMLNNGVGIKKIVNIWKEMSQADV